MKDKSCHCDYQCAEIPASSFALRASRDKTTDRGKAGTTNETKASDELFVVPPLGGSSAHDANGCAVTINFDRLATFFRADLNVVFATVFGSSVDGIVAPGSDLDVAVLFHDLPSAGEDMLAYYNRLCDVVPEVERVDFVDLNRASPILAFEALQGRMLFKNDAEATAAYSSLVCREYEDVMGYLAYFKWAFATGFSDGVT